MRQRQSIVVVQGSTPLWRGARHLLLLRGSDYAARGAAVRANPGIDEIHDFRVASRRLRAALSLFEPCYPQGAFRQVRRQVRQVTRLLGAIRNEDEAQHFFSVLSQELDPADRLALMPYLMAREAARSVYLAEMSAGIDRLRPERFVARNRTILATPALVRVPAGLDPFLPLRQFAERTMSEGHAALLPLVTPSLVRDDDAARHRLRIALKQYRYRLELFEPLADERYAGIYQLIKKYQELLGALNDLTVFDGMVAAGLVVTAPFRAGISAHITQRKAEQVRDFLKLLKDSPLDLIRFPFGG